MKKTLIIALLMGFLSPFSALAHPGKTDKYDCHVCRSNCAMWDLKVGQYHCHKNQFIQATPTPKETPKQEQKIAQSEQKSPKIQEMTEEEETPKEQLSFLEKCLKWLKGDF